MKKISIIFSVLMALLLLTVAANAQTGKKNYFAVSSTNDMGDKNYGVVNVNADKHTVVIGTVMANGENVKGISIQINNGFAFKLAPAQAGMILNYMGTNLNIVLQPGDKAKIEFITAGKGTAARQLYVSGENIE